MSAALLMTASDICAVCKPWPIQFHTVHLIYQEFHDQVITRITNNRIGFVLTSSVKDTIWVSFRCQSDLGCYQGAPLVPWYHIWVSSTSDFLCNVGLIMIWWRAPYMTLNGFLASVGIAYGAPKFQICRWKIYQISYMTWLKPVVFVFGCHGWCSKRVNG